MMHERLIERRVASRLVRNRSWRCVKCGALLGIRCGAHVKFRYKQAAYAVSGSAFVVVTVCRICGKENHLSQRDPPQ